MRNYYFITVMVGLLFMGCSVDNDEMNFNEGQLQSVNLEMSDECTPSIYEIENSEELIGNVTVTNSSDGSMAFLNFNAEDGFYISEIRIAIADDLSGIPHNNGGIIPGRLEKVTYDSVTEAEFEYAVSNSLVFAALLTIVDGDGKKNTSWIGDESQWSNDSSYMSYEVCIPQQEPTCEADAGPDNSEIYSYSELISKGLESQDIKDLYLNLLDENVSRSGTFNPTIEEMLRYMYSNEANRYGDFKTLYTIENELNGNFCYDSVELVITIIR